ncbi:MAG: hypothetical protein AMJ90_01815 [candidate division Zixibacteria bacterium SM23_73_2]|nr:MAG: hypothetical protein AMJ90_01815 [candidate division Zixibacteria bacterium SM23_73_2]
MKEEIPERIKKITEQVFPKLVKLRREFHQYPELSYQEFETSKRVARELKKLGLEVKTRIAKTGVVGLLKGSKKGKTAALRADMDALPLDEQTNLPYKSKNRGVMHACGHDLHMACVLGCAVVLTRLKDQLSGKVKFIFQPSEEVTPGGAKPMIDQGVLENPKVNGIFALHSDSAIPVGKVGVKYGEMMAQADSFDLVIKGKGGHGARPQDGVDAIVVASQVICALQTIASRNISPVSPVVVSIGQIDGGTARNIICDRVVLKGTVRSLDSKVAKSAPSLINRIASGVVKSFGADFELEYHPGYPVLINDEKMTHIAQRATEILYGKDKVYHIKEPMMGAEDFAYFLKKVPGTMMRLGTRNQKIKATYPWHHPKFKVDETALKYGVSVMSLCIWNFLTG